MNSLSNKHNNSWLGVGLIAAFTASLCCVVPVAAFLAGIGSLAAAFSWVEPLRPWLIGITVLFLGAAWYKQWKAECACEEKPAFWQTKKFLGIATVLALLLVSFPFYGASLFPNRADNSIQLSKNNVKEVTFNVSGMVCEACAGGVRMVVSEVEGVVEADASYKTGKVSVRYDRTKTTPEEIKNAINQTIFSVTEN